MSKLPADPINKGDIFSRPACIVEAQETSRSKNLIVEILIFFLVFLIYNAILNIIIVIPIMIHIFSSVNLEQLASLSSEQIMELFVELQYNLPDWINILTLFATGIGIVAVIFYCRKVEKRSMATMGFAKKNAFVEYVIGFIMGIFMFSAAILICVLTGTLEIKGIAATISPVIILLYLAAFMVQGLNEELLCRGYLMVSVSRRYSLPVAILANSLLFGALHLANNGITLIAFLNLILFGIFASVYFIKRGNIWGIAAFHTVWNFVQGNIYGIYVSGNNYTTSLLESEISESGQIINGGTFGLEGGVAVTIVLLVGLVILCATKSRAQE